MKLQYLQHVPFEGPANIERWAVDRGHEVAGVRLHAGEKLPGPDRFDWLVVMGGPMGVHDKDVYPWLSREKDLIGRAIRSGKPVLGICLGAQLVATVLGAEVYENPHYEIGWYPVTATPNARDSPLFSSLPKKFVAFHWHGDTFDVPEGAERMYGNEACPNQAFGYGDTVVALQFHLEVTDESIKELIDASTFEEGRFVQTENELTAPSEELTNLNRYLYTLLDAMAGQ